jgi:hypothetical protein
VSDLSSQEIDYFSRRIEIVSKGRFGEKDEDEKSIITSLQHASVTATCKISAKLDDRSQSLRLVRKHVPFQSKNQGRTTDSLILNKIPESRRKFEDPRLVVGNSN